jgi:predicted metal-dependent hydrolase
MPGPADRDRDEEGRPRTRRPRDELGRPLPRGAPGALVEEPPPASLEEALDRGIAHFNAGRFFPAHEAWEEAWHRAEPAERDFWQGLVQVAVGLTHRERGNAHGCATLLRRGARRLAAYGETHRGVPVARLRSFALAAADAVERDGLAAPVEVPRIERSAG